MEHFYPHGSLNPNNCSSLIPPHTSAPEDLVGSNLDRGAIGLMLEICSYGGAEVSVAKLVDNGPEPEGLLYGYLTQLASHGLLDGYQLINSEGQVSVMQGNRRVVEADAPRGDAS